jgi:hypothetical protein
MRNISFISTSLRHCASSDEQGLRLRLWRINLRRLAAFDHVDRPPGKFIRTARANASNSGL